MAKFLQNDNESPEVDLKNLTVKLAGMGLDEEIDEVIPGKKEKKKKDSKQDAEEESASEEKESTEAVEDPSDDEKSEETEEVDDSDDAEDADESDEVSDFYEKRAAERDLTLEKVEELEEKMESSTDDKKQKVSAIDTIIAKSEKKTSEDENVKEKKKAKIDGVAIAGIVLAILALLGGAFYLYRSVHQEPNLGMTERNFRTKYYLTPVFESILSYGFTFPEPAYRDEVEAAAATASETTVKETADATAIVTEVKSDYRYCDYVVKNNLGMAPIMVTVVECKSNNYMKSIRFCAPLDDDEFISFYNAPFAGFLQVFFEKEDGTFEESQVCVDKIKNAYAQSVASTETAVMIKDGNIAYSVTKANVDGVPCYVMDIVPAKEADDFVFYNSYLGR